MANRTLLSAAVLMSALLVTYLAGCSRSPQTDAPKQPTGPTLSVAPASDVSAEHAHKAGAHGGNIVEIGRDDYHAEAVFEAGGALHLYLLGRDESRLLEIDTQTLTAYAKPEGGSDARAITLDPDPQPGDTNGKTSRFRGTLPRTLANQVVEVTVPSIRIGTDRFRFTFRSAAVAHNDTLPPKVAGADEQKLYLTPGGKYTAADIKANGSVTASERFRGEKAAHNLRPGPGDAICPVTLTKANAKFTWIVGGKAYQFCCPPCVDEFVTLAKEHPEQIQDPDEYRKR